jgi:bifunctional non-homologous end joining protein LigD
MLPKSQSQYVTNSEALRIAAKLKGAKGASFPKFIEPALAMTRDKPPSGDGWLHEIKFDGYRLQIHLREGQARFYTRKGNDWTPRFKDLQEPLWHLPTHGAVIDGEVVLLSPEGVSDFDALGSDLGAGRSDRLSFYGFDLMYLDGWDLRGCALIDRKRALQALIGELTGPVRYSWHIEGSGQRVYEDACRLHLEGIVSKRRHSRYPSGRTADWRKVACRERETFVIAGIAYKGKKFDGIYLAWPGDMSYAGKVANGITRASQWNVEFRARNLHTHRQPLKKKIKKPKAHWLKPKLKVEVEYRALTGKRRLRHPSFKGVRQDL